MRKALEQFARDAGVQIIQCDPEWGGTIGYKSNDYPNCCCCGFKSAAAAYRHWLESTFGKQTSKALMKLLATSKP